MVDMAKLHSPICSTSKHWLYDMQLGAAMEKNWALSAHQQVSRCCSLQCISSICWAYFSDVTASLGVRKLYCMRPVADYLFWCKSGSGKGSAASSQSSQWAGHGQFSHTIHFSSHITIWLRNGLLLLSTIREDDTRKWQYFWFSVSSWGAHLIELFHLSNLFQKPNNCRRVSTEFFDNFSCNPKRISLDDGSQLVTVNFWWLATTLLIFKTRFLCKTSWTTTAMYVR